MTKLSDKLLAQGFPEPKGNSKIAHVLRRVPVSESPEFNRVLALPRRKIELVEGQDYVTVLKNGVSDKIPDLTRVFAKPGGQLKLKPLQNAAIWDAYNQNGGFYPLSVGEGKSLISLLIPEALNSQRTVLLVKPELRNKLLTQDIPFYGRHFYLPLNRIFVVAYSELSSAKKADILDQIKPDLIVSDEAHSLRHRSSARTRRFLRYMRNNPETRFVALSGTMATRSIMDFAHLIELALKKGSPLPNNFKDLEEWSEALDAPPEEARPPGVLIQFCEGNESPRQGFRHRMIETPGVVSSKDMSIGTSLVIEALPLETPDLIKAELKKLYDNWAIEDEELADPMAVMRVARQIASGFYYKWAWPEGVKDVAWVEARRAWNREVRTYLLHSSRTGMDSPLLLWNAAARGEWQAESFSRWAEQKYKPEPPVATVWLSYYVVKAAIEWGKKKIAEGAGGIIWSEHTAIAQTLSRATGWPLYGEGSDAGASDKKTEPVIICTIKSQSDGKNLQSHSQMLILSPPANGRTWEQLIGRAHRYGQTADEVKVDVLLHTKEFRSAFDQAMKDAQFLEETQGLKQKLLFADKLLDNAWSETKTETKKEGEA